MKVLIADDNAVVRMGLRALLEGLAEVTDVIEAADGREAVDKVRSESPDIALLDVRMPRLDGLGVLSEIRNEVPALMLTHSEEPDVVRLALDRGASGYLVHGQVTPGEIAAALQTCVQGGLVLSGPAAAAMLQGVQPDEAPDHPFRSLLTPSEFSVLEAAAGGTSNAEIAEDLFLSARTVKNYLNSAYGKLGVHTRADAVAAWHTAEHEAPKRGPNRGARP